MADGCDPIVPCTSMFAASVRGTHVACARKLAGKTDSPLQQTTQVYTRNGHRRMCGVWTQTRNRGLYLTACGVLIPDTGALCSATPVPRLCEGKFEARQSAIQYSKARIAWTRAIVSIEA